MYTLVSLIKRAYYKLIVNPYRYRRLGGVGNKVEIDPTVSMTWGNVYLKNDI